MGNPNIDELDGPELNKAIAESIFRWNIYHYNDSRCYFMLTTAEGDPVSLTYGTKPFGKWRDYEHATEAEAWAKDCPDFCQDIAAAWLVIMHLSPEWFWQITNEPRDFGVWLARGATSITVEAATVPLAICRAALQAVHARLASEAAATP